MTAPAVASARDSSPARRSGGTSTCSSTERRAGLAQPVTQPGPPSLEPIEQIRFRERAAQMLLDQHTANNQQLISIMQSKGHRIAPGLPAELQQKVSTLSTLSGAAFDQEFVRMTGVADHKAAIAAFEQGDRSVTDRDLQAYIDKTLPALRSHLQMAQDLAGRMAG